MNTVWEILYLRQMALHYVAPPICEVIFSGSSSPVIVLSEPSISQVTGLVLSGSGVFRLSWNAFPGSICFNVYFIGGDNVAVPLAQCITDPFFDIPPGIGPGELVVTPITLEGEGPPSDPIDLPGGGGIAYSVSVVGCPQASVDNFPVAFTIVRNGTSGNLLVNFTMSGTAVNGTDYLLIAESAVIPNGSDFVLVEITPIEAALLVNKTATLTLDESLTYFVDPPASASMLLRPALLKITGYGGAEPLFTPDPLALDSDACEWDGSWNRTFTGATTVWTYNDVDGNDNFGGSGSFKVSIQGKQGFSFGLLGPFPTDWFISIAIAGGADVWTGSKVGGASAAGVYTRTGGTDLRAQITVEVVP